jgi:hypothetical protein
MRKNRIFSYAIVGIVILAIIVFLAFFSSMCLPQKCREYEITIGIGKKVVKAIQEFQNREGYFPSHLDIVLTDGIRGKYPSIFKNDSWGHSYVYKSQKNHTKFFLYSIGAIVLRK